MGHALRYRYTGLRLSVLSRYTPGPTGSVPYAAHIGGLLSLMILPHLSPYYIFSQLRPHPIQVLDLKPDSSPGHKKQALV